MKVIRILSLLLLSAFAFSSYADDFELVDKNNQAMNKAFKKAKGTLKNFLKIVMKRPKHLSDYSAYLKYEDKGEVEYLWVVDVKKYDKEHYIGVVVSKPRLVTNVKYESIVGFKKSDIYDWEYFNKNTKKTYGAFTTCALLKKNNAEDQQYIKDRGLAMSTITRPPVDSRKYG